MIRYTSKVRRGLGYIHSLLLDALNDDMPPATTIVAGWKLSVQREFNAAMDWIEQETAEPDPQPTAAQVVDQLAPKGKHF